MKKKTKWQLCLAAWYRHHPMLQVTDVVPSDDFRAAWADRDRLARRELAAMRKMLREFAFDRVGDCRCCGFTGIEKNNHAADCAVAKALGLLGK